MSLVKGCEASVTPVRSGITLGVSGDDEHSPTEGGEQKTVCNHIRCKILSKATEGPVWVEGAFQSTHKALPIDSCWNTWSQLLVLFWGAVEALGGTALLEEWPGGKP